MKEKEVLNALENKIGTALARHLEASSNLANMRSYFDADQFHSEIAASTVARATLLQFEREEAYYRAYYTACKDCLDAIKFEVLLNETFGEATHV